MNMTDEISYEGDERCPVCGSRVPSDEYTEVEVWHDGTVGLMFHCPKCGTDWDNVYTYGHSLVFQDGRFAKE